MRPHKLRMKAFGPFAQETVVDFDKMGNNIFLISGDTGIGKTTIFDGMIYALYGKASGGNRSSLGTEALHSDYCKDGNHKDKMEVEFSFSNAGRNYTVLREMSWGKSGNNQTAVKESTLSEDNSVIIHSKGREDRDDVTLKIQEILGLDADQFRRIIMLAQGEFQKFLASGSDDRGKILGKLFDNRRHIDMQSRLKAAYKVIDNKLKDNSRDIRSQTESFILPPDYDGKADRLNAEDPELLNIMENVINKLDIENKTLSENISTINTKFIKLSNEMVLAQKNNRLLDDLDIQKNELNKLKSQDEAIKTLNKKLEPAKSAKELMPVERLSGDAEYELDRKSKNIIILNSEKEKLNPELSGLKNAAEEAEKENLPKIEDYKKKQNTFEGILHLYDELKDAENLSRQSNRDFEMASKNVLQKKQKLDDIESSLNYVNVILSQLENAGDLAVNESKRLLDEQKKRKGQLTDLENRTSELYEKRNNLSDLKFIVAKAQKKAHEAQGKHYRLNGAFLSGQAGLLAQEMRNELQTKSEVICPVCRTKHTAADINSFAICHDDIPTREQVDKAFSEWSKAKEKADTLEKQFAAEEASYNNSMDALLEKLSELTGVSDKDELWQGTALGNAQKQCDSDIEKYDSEYQKAVDDKLKKDKANEKKRELESAKESCESELSDAKEKAQKASEESSAANARFDEKRKELAGYPETKHQALGLIQDLKAKAEVLQKKTDNARNLYIECKNRLENIEGRLKNAGDEKISAEEKAKNTKLEFEAGLVRYGFGDMIEYISAKSPEGILLDTDRLDRWIRDTERKINDHTVECHKIEAKIAQLENDTKGCVKTDLNEFKKNINSVKQELNQKTEKANLLGYNLKTNRIVYKNTTAYIKERQKYITAAQKLKPLSDAANGNYTFSRYVLGDFFHRIIDQANIHLDIMTDGEYSLTIPKEIKDGRKSIGLDVKVYSSVTGLERETASLSGGQLFEASLSLALGLSDIVQMESSSTVQIDSMFIDEGFGSLDSTRLDKAINVLQHLSEGKRQIGIISHVARLDECLPKKIHVMKRTNGKGSEIRIETDD